MIKMEHRRLIYVDTLDRLYNLDGNFTNCKVIVLADTSD